MDNLKIYGQIKQIHSMPIDNVFLHTLYYGGIYGYVFYLVLYFVSFRKSDMKHNSNIFILFLTVFMYGLVENHSNQGESFVMILVFIQLLDSSKLKQLDELYKEEKIETKEKDLGLLEENL